jgi:hypothetical protein
MDGECGTHEWQEKYMQGSYDENWTEIGHWEELGVDRCTVKIGLKYIGWYGVDLDSSGSSRKHLDVECVFCYNLDAVCETKLMNLLL